MSKDILQTILEAENAASGVKLHFDSGLRMGQGGGWFNRSAGASQEFLEYRDYILGDDLRRIDWSVYARNDKLTVKCFQQEVSPRLDIVIDSSSSLTVPERKKHATMGLAAYLATAASNALFSVKTWQSDKGFEELVNGRSTPSEWIVPKFDSQISPQEAWNILPPRLQNQGVVIFISDLLWQDQPEKMLSALSENADHIIVIHVLAEEERHPDISGAMRLEDGETGTEVELIVDDNLIAKYKEKLANHCQFWEEACHSHQTVFVEITAEQFLLKPEIIQLKELGIIA